MLRNIQCAPELVERKLRSAGTPGQCSATACIDLSKYPFMNTNTCICNSPALGSIAARAGRAVHHYIAAAIGGLLPLRV